MDATHNDSSSKCATRRARFKGIRARCQACDAAFLLPVKLCMALCATVVESSHFKTKTCAVCTETAKPRFLLFLAALCTSLLTSKLLRFVAGNDIVERAAD